MIRIELLDHRNLSVACEIHGILASAHAQEVELFQATHALPPERTTDEIQSSNEYFLGAFREDELLGSISVGPDDEPGQINIASLIVHPEHQRQGLAKSLLTEALRLGNGAAFSVVTGAANAPALALYREFGFVEYRRGTLGPELLVMVKLRRTYSNET